MLPGEGIEQSHYCMTTLRQSTVERGGKRDLKKNAEDVKKMDKCYRLNKPSHTAEKNAEKEKKYGANVT